MMIEITTRCTMGCTHCMSNATPDGKDMAKETLLDALDFLRNNNLGKILIITGGEPLEHRDFGLMMDTIIDYTSKYETIKCLILTTNGELLPKDTQRFKDYVKRFEEIGVQMVYQISADKRFYPRRIDVTKRIYREKGFELVDNCISQIYPQGRALNNNMEYKALSPKCFNVRSFALKCKDLSQVEGLLVKNKFFTEPKLCTPFIDVDGNIKLGESYLCKPCASIYEDMETIMGKIRNFKCNGCKKIYLDKIDLYCEQKGISKSEKETMYNQVADGSLNSELLANLISCTSDASKVKRM